MKTKKSILNDHSKELDTEKYNPATDGLSIGNPCTDIPIGMADNKGTFAGISRKNNAIDSGPIPTPQSPGNAAATGDPSHSPKQKQQTRTNRYLTEPPLSGSKKDLFIETEATAIPKPTKLSTIPPILSLGLILTALSSESKYRAIARAGEQLIAGGYAHPSYITSMMLQETIASSYYKQGIAIVQGTQSGFSEVLHVGITILQYPEGVMFGHHQAYFVIGIANPQNNHPETNTLFQELLQKIPLLKELKSTTDKRVIYEKIKL